MNKDRHMKWGKMALILLIGVAIVGMALILPKVMTHFVGDIYINGINCKGETVTSAKDRIDEKSTVVLMFPDGSSRQVSIKELGKEVSTATIKEIFNHREELKDAKIELQPSDYIINEEQLENYLEEIPQLSSDRIIQPENAYLTMNDYGLFEIVPEVDGTKIEISQAFFYVLQKLKDGEDIIDLTEISQNVADIQRDDPELVEKMNEFNNMLKANIKYTLKDGSVCQLDYETIKSWIINDGTYELNTLGTVQTNWSTAYAEEDEHIEEFVNDMQSKVKELGSKAEFKTTSGETLTLDVESGYQDKIDIEKETEAIKQALENGESIDREPIYKRNNDFSKINSYVEVDIDAQNVYMYLNGECIVNTPCVTGTVKTGHSTPPGIFYLATKETERYLRGNNDDGSTYSSFVHYWMPFNGGVGLHDATWRGRFGGTIYQANGSHGCVNLPLEAARTIFENITYSMPIIVH